MKAPTRNYPLEPPTEGRAYSTAARTLGWHPAAAALATLGYFTQAQVTVRDQSGSGAVRTAFFVVGNPRMPEQSIKAAEQLVTGGIAGHKGSLEATNPCSPFLAALAAVENLAALVEWNARGGPVPVAHRDTSPGGSPFLFLQPDARRRKCSAPLPWTAQAKPCGGITVATVAAAMIACGFVPLPEPVTSDNGEAAIAFASGSATLPGFTFFDAVRAVNEVASQDAAAGTLRAPIVIPGFPPDEHPFLYALRAANNVGVLQGMASRAGANPVRNFVSRFNSKRTAFVTDSLLGAPANSGLVRELEKHLTRT